MDRNKNKALLIAMPRTTSTAFGRALAESLQTPVAHETIIPEVNSSLNIDYISRKLSSSNNLSQYLYEKLQTTKEFSEFSLRDALDFREQYKILKEMPAFLEENSDIEHPSNEDMESAKKHYSDVIKDIALNSHLPIVFLTGNPANIFCSIMRANINEYEESEQFNEENFRNEAKTSNNTVTENFKALKNLKEFLQSHNISFIEFNRENVGQNPATAIEEISSAWNMKLHTNDLSLAPVVEPDEEELSEEQKVNAHYRLSYNDGWVGLEERDDTHFKTSPDTQTSENSKQKLLSLVEKKSKGSISKERAQEILESIFENVSKIQP
jgi:hypothetical protein